MSDYLGIDTSNYTTSAALYNADNNSIIQKKMMLPVKDGEKGLRQSDAVFHHTVQLPQVIKDLFDGEKKNIGAIGVSASPRSEDGSYMPCFLTGTMVAECLSAVNDIPVFRFSHQMGHIASVAVFSGNEQLLKERFIAFHLSGGTTEVLLVTADEKQIFKTEIIAKSLDLKAGQAIDRTGVMLGMHFPCGAELDSLSVLSDKEYKIKPSMKSSDCSLSGIENKCKKMFSDGEKYEDIAKFCLTSIIGAVDAMANECRQKYGNLPILFSGGVSANTLLRKHFSEKYDAVFAPAEFSSDNSAGIAYLAALKNKGNLYD